MMKYMIGLIIVALITTATTSYGQTYRERRSKLPQEFKWDFPQFLNQIMPKIEAQFDKRDKAFNEARKLLQDNSTSSLDKKDDWKEAHQRQADEQLKAFTTLFNETNALIDRVATDPSSPHFKRLRAEVPNWVMVVGGAITDSHQKAGNMPLASLRDRLVTFRKRYEEEHKSLEAKWNRLTSSDNAIDSRAASNRSALLAACQPMTDASRRGDADLTALVNAEITSTATLEEARAFRRELEQRTDRLISDLTRYVDVVSRNIAPLRDTFSQERTFVKMLVEARKSATAFSDEINQNIATTLFDTSLQLSLNSAGKMSNAADQVDLKAYVEHARPDVKAHFESFKTVFNAFRTAFVGRFVEDVNADTFAVFIEDALWTDWANGIKRCDPQAALRTLKDHNARRWGARLSDVADLLARNEFESALNVSKAELDDVINEADSFSRRLLQIAELQERESLQDLLESS